MAPLVIDLFCGKGGWTIGLQAVGFRCIGFDIERHNYPGELVLQDVATLDGAQVAKLNPALIVASPPCQAYSYPAMPWKRAKALPPPDNALFEACFRIQRECSEALGHYVPMVVENVCGAQVWVGRAKWHYGSFYLWGDVPALMPSALHRKIAAYSDPRRNGGAGKHLTSPRENAEGIKVPGIKLSQVGFNIAAARMIDGKPDGFERTAEMVRQHIGYSRKEASALIAMIPRPLAEWIGRVYLPDCATIKRCPPAPQPGIASLPSSSSRSAARAGKWLRSRSAGLSPAAAPNPSGSAGRAQPSASSSLSSRPTAASLTAVGECVTISLTQRPAAVKETQ